MLGRTRWSETRIQIEACERQSARHHYRRTSRAGLSPPMSSLAYAPATLHVRRHGLVLMAHASRVRACIGRTNWADGGDPHFRVRKIGSGKSHAVSVVITRVSTHQLPYRSVLDSTLLCERTYLYCNLSITYKLLISYITLYTRLGMAMGLQASAPVAGVQALDVQM